MSKLKRLEEAELSAALEHQKANQANVKITGDAWFLAATALEKYQLAKGVSTPPCCVGGDVMEDNGYSVCSLCGAAWEIDMST
jgi:hypothetical protein